MSQSTPCLTNFFCVKSNFAGYLVMVQWSWQLILFKLWTALFDAIKKIFTLYCRLKVLNKEHNKQNQITEQKKMNIRTFDLPSVEYSCSEFENCILPSSILNSNTRKRTSSLSKFLLHIDFHVISRNILLVIKAKISVKFIKIRLQTILTLSLGTSSKMRHL